MGLATWACWRRQRRLNDIIVRVGSGGRQRTGYESLEGDDRTVQLDDIVDPTNALNKRTPPSRIQQEEAAAFTDAVATGTTIVLDDSDDYRDADGTDTVAEKKRKLEMRQAAENETDAQLRRARTQSGVAAAADVMPPAPRRSPPTTSQRSQPPQLVDKY